MLECGITVIQKILVPLPFEISIFEENLDSNIYECYFSWPGNDWWTQLYFSCPLEATEGVWDWENDIYLDIYNAIRWPNGFPWWRKFLSWFKKFLDC